VLIKVQPAAKEWIVARGTELRFGARPLRRAIERELVDPLSRFIASAELQAGDLVEIEREGDSLAFYRDTRVAQNLVTSESDIGQDLPVENAKVGG